jgi:hypothetical protein
MPSSQKGTLNTTGDKQNNEGILEPSESVGVKLQGLTNEMGLGCRRETVIIIRNNRPPTE